MKLVEGFSPHPNCYRSMDLLKWECLIPGKDATDWHNGFYPLTLEFTEEYPSRPPKVRIQWQLDETVY